MLINPAALLAVVLVIVGVENRQDSNQSLQKETEAEAWESLFDGKTLDGWKISEFGGQDRIEVIDGAIVMEMGYPLAGITYDDKWSVEQYELTLEAKAIEGNDFFCCVTFPVDDQFCSFVVGGWAGSVTGISCIDSKDASENETTTHRVYEKDRWYRVDIAVTESTITCKIDEETVVDLKREGKQLSLRPEVLASKPFGICCFETRSAVRDIRVRRIK